MQLLIDTHILIWFLEGNNLLANARRQIMPIQITTFL